MPFCTNCGKQNPELNKFCIDCGSALVQSNKIAELETLQSIATPLQALPQKESSDETIELIKSFAIEYKRTLLISLGLIIVFIVLYELFLKANPVKDAKKAAMAYCNCAEKYNEELIKTDQDFINSFSSNNFKNRQTARIKLMQSLTPANTANSECLAKARINYTRLRNSYINNVEKITEFDVDYSAEYGVCIQNNQNKLTSVYSEVEKKIFTIKDPEPDIEKIKSDLIGKKMPGWNFDALSEFNKADIIKTTHGKDRIEYAINLHLVGLRLQEPHDAEIIVSYNQGEEGWNFGDVKEVFYTYTNTAPVNSWIIVTPQQNCSYKIIDNGQKYWVQDGQFGPKYKSGGNEPPSFLRSSQIYLMSGEDRSCRPCIQIYS